MKKPKAGQPTQAYGSKNRSHDQRKWNAAVGLTAAHWEWLTDQERLTWRVYGEARRRSGYNCFIGANARHVCNGLPLLRLPPPDAPPVENPVVELIITNTGDRIWLLLHVPRQPSAPISVWGSRPCKLGIANCHKCPRLGLLPPPKRGFCDITAIYFAKHAAYIHTHRVPLVGKRIFIRTRVELDGGLKLFKSLSAVVPAPGGRSTSSEKA